MMNLIVFHFDNYVDDLEWMILWLLEAIDHEQLNRNDDYDDIEIFYRELIAEVIHNMSASFSFILKETTVKFILKTLPREYKLKRSSFSISITPFIWL